MMARSGRSRNVWSEPSPASVAILMDASGSMASKMARARETANALVAGLKPGADEVAFYAFDTTLQEVRPFSTNFTATDTCGRRRGRTARHRCGMRLRKQRKKFRTGSGGGRWSSSPTASTPQAR